MVQSGTRSLAQRPGPLYMDLLLRRCGLSLSADQLEQLWVYHQLLRRHTAELNLTRIHNFENMVLKLYADSMLPALHVPLPTPLLDLGSGPGMPGIPLKIFRPDLHILLAESRQKRCEFLNRVVAALGIPGLDVVPRGIAADFSRPVVGVITRAVEPIADTLARVTGCLVDGGRVLFMKGPGCDAEIEAASVRLTPNYELADDIAYRIPRTSHRRRLVIYRRKAHSGPVGKVPRSVKRQRTKTIASPSNSIFKALQKLLGGRGVSKQARTLVCGKRLANEALERFPDRCRAWISSGDGDPPPSQAPGELEWLQLTPDLFQRLDAFGTKSPMVLFEVPAPEPWRPELGRLPGCSLLVPFQDPENVGAVIRAAAAFAVDRVILLSECANPFHPKAVRASAGAVFSARLVQGPSLMEIPDDLPVIALAASGRPITRIRFPQSFCLLAGMEGPGLPSRWLTDAAAIPMAPGVGSLNAAVATAIALYEWRRR